MESRQKQPELYEPRFEYDGCGIDAVASIRGTRNHCIMDQALHIIENLEHRARKDAEGETRNGMGTILQTSRGFSKKVTGPLGFQVGGERGYSVGMSFFPQDELIHNQAMKIFEIIVRGKGMTFLEWEVVPTASETLEKKILDVVSYAAQGFMGKPAGMKAGLGFDRRLYITHHVFGQSNEDIYVVFLSGRTIVYKDMFLTGGLRLFFSGLQGEDYKSAIIIVHSRLSINTDSSWMRAHPYRFIAHNGEISTIRGNVGRMVTRKENMESEYFGYDMHKVLPIINQEGSNSATLDNVLEFMVMNGVDLSLAVMVTIPAP